MKIAAVGQKIVVYYRVGTRRHGKRKGLTVLGLGLEAQKEAVARYARQHKMEIVAEYIEIETGKIAERPELQNAIARAQLARAVLVVAKLARMAHNIRFTSALMNSGVDFVCCDNPNANRFTIHILATAAKDEAIRISQCTTAALAVLKQEGVQLGSAAPDHWTGRQHLRFHKDNAGLVKKANRLSAMKRRENAKAAYALLIQKIREMRKQDKLLREVADWLNEQGHRTTRGSKFRPGTVKRIVELFDGEEGSVVTVKF